MAAKKTPAKPASPAKPSDVVKAAPPTPITPEGIALATAVAPQPLDAAEVVGDAEQLSYRVISPLRHNGQRYQINDLVELHLDEFARLRRLGVVTDQPALS